MNSNNDLNKIHKEKYHSIQLKNGEHFALSTPTGTDMVNGTKLREDECDKKNLNEKKYSTHKNRITFLLVSFAIQLGSY